MNIFEENNYKVILKHYILDESSQPKWGIYKKISDYLNVNPSLVSQVISGSKDFTEEQIITVCEFLGLGKLESKYLLSLVLISRAGSVSLKKYFEEQLLEIRKQALNLSRRLKDTKTLSDSEQFKFYSTWLYSAIHLMTTLDQKPNFKTICDRFHLSPQEAQEVISFLVEIGLVLEKEGEYFPGVKNTHLAKSSIFIVNHHRNWRLKAIQAVDHLTEQELMYTCNFSVSRKDFSVIREEFMKVIQKFLKIAQESPAEDLAQLNIDLFWLRE